MSNKSISANKIFKIIEFYALNGLNKTQIAKALNISRGQFISMLIIMNNLNLLMLTFSYIKTKLLRI